MERESLRKLRIKMKKLKIISFIVIIASLGIAQDGITSAQLEAIKKITENINTAPDFTLTSLDDSTYTLSNMKDNVVLVNFWATWCGPCRAIAPVIDELHTELDGKAVIGKVNVDENSDTPVNYGVRNIPTLLIFKNGEVVDKVVGNQPKSKLVELLEAHM